MRIFLIYVLIALLINITANTLPSLVNIAKRNLLNLIVLTSYPAAKTLTYSQNLINRYIVLVNAQKENKSLREKLAMCKIYGNILQKKLNNQIKNNFRLLEAPFSFKGNFKTDKIYLRITKKINPFKNYCIVLSNKLSLIGLIDKKTGKDIYSAKSVFNPSFVADVFILSNNKRYKALFLGHPYLPKVEFLDPNVEIKKGNKVYTSGDFGIFPPGLFIGSVSSVKDINGYYKLAYIDIDRSFFNSWKVFVLCKKK